jgi:hypothetical protein
LASARPFSASHRGDVSRLAKDGVVPAPAERGSYDLPAVVTAWVAYLSRERTGSDTFAAAKLDFWRARASREQHEADELAGNLLAKEEVRRVLGEMAVELGAALNRLALREKNGTRRSYGASWPSHDGMTIAELSWKADIANSCDQSFNGRATFEIFDGSDFKLADDSERVQVPAHGTAKARATRVTSFEKPNESAPRLE